MNEKERIDFIRENGTEEMKAGLKAVFGRNDYKPKREEMWENRLHRGKRMVETIRNSNGKDEDQNEGLEEFI